MTTHVTFDEFKKMDIRIGTVRTAVIVPDADKLLQLEVDFGEDKRQIVSGIREYFDDPQDIVGKQFPFILNLEPRTIKGIESQGMLIAVGGGGSFTALIPETEVPSGTKVV
jgi:methionyl-tRNA synthetase